MNALRWFAGQGGRTNVLLMIVTCWAAVLSQWVQAADLPDPRVAKMIAEVKQTDLVNLVRQLSGEDPIIVGANAFALTNRNSNFTLGIGKATQFAHDELQALGLSVVYQNWSGGFPFATGRNVIAVQPGGSLSNEIVYVTAHIDDLPSYGRAPGSDDNASGTASVLAAARSFSQRQFDRTIKYALFTGEEQNLAGSQEAAKQAQRAGEMIVAVVNLDMIAWDAIGLPIATVRTRPPDAPGYSNDVAIVSVFTNVVAAYGLADRIVPAIISDGQRSDQASFWQYGYPGILAIEDIEGDFNPYYHTSNDSLSQFNLRYYTAFAQAGIGTAAQLASPAGDAPFEAIEVASSDWRVGSPIGAGLFYARHDLGATESGADAHDVAWASAVAPTNRMWFKAASQPDATQLQTDSRPWTSESLFSGNLIFVNNTGAATSSSNAVRFGFITPPLSNRVYAVRVRVDGDYTVDGTAFEIIANLQQVVATGNGFVRLPMLTNLADGVVYGTFDIAARFLDRTSGFNLRVESAAGNVLTVSTSAQVGAIVTDVLEVSTNLSPNAVWVPWQSYTNYVGAADSGEFEAGWSRVTTQTDASSWGEPGAHFLRVNRSWQQ